MHGNTSFIIAGALAASAAFAQEGVDFERMDGDGDGRLTETEWRSSPQTVSFDMADTNRDGFLDEAEVTAASASEQQAISAPADEAATVGTSAISQDETSPEEQPRSVGLYDTDRDGRVSQDEAQKDGELVTHFVAWDTNEDGYLNQGELESGTTEMSEQRASSAGGGTAGTIDPATFDEADTDRDNRVSRAEAQTFPVDVLVISFDAYDANRDGYLDRDELQGTSTSGEEQLDDAYQTTDRDDTQGAGMSGSSGEIDTGKADYSASAISTSAPGDDAGTSVQFETLDRNGDSRLDESEAEDDDFIRANFEIWDTDDDGFVSRDEAARGWTEGGALQEQHR